MDVNKIIKYVLYAVAAVLGLMIYNTWHKDYPTQSSHTSTQAQASKNNDYVPQAFSAKSPSAVAPAKASSAGTSTASTVSAPSFTPVSMKGFINVKTDLLDIAIDPVGGNIVSAKLLKYPVSTKQKNTPIQILNPNADNLYIAQSGLANGGNQNVNFHATSSHYLLGTSQNKMTVTLKGQTSNGLRVDKVYTFYRGDYKIGLDTHVENASSKPWQGGFYHQIIRKNIPAAHPYLNRRSYNGASISTHEKPYDKLAFKSMAEEDLNKKVTSGWVAMQQPYFVSSWVPQAKTQNEFYTRSKGDGKNGANNIFTLGFVSPQVTLLPGKSASNQSTFYVGPELAGQLNKAAPNLSNTIDYGWLAPVSMIIFWVMKHLFAIIGNWGWTIILVTFLIKLVFYPLSDKSYKSMAKMRIMQPRIKSIQERYAGDKQAINKATMEFYKKEKLNPMGGCLPMLIQIPVFFALYYVLIESVQLRQAPWIFWIHDLSIRDPSYILPLLMGASMFLQQRLSPPPPDPTQAKVMMFMPIIFTVMFLWFPAGLVLYWLTNNLLSILHQWYVLRTFDPKKERYKKRDKLSKKK